MGDNLLNIEHGSNSLQVNAAESGNLHLKVAVGSTSIHGGLSMQMELTETDIRGLKDVLETYLTSRETKFAVGDIVYEPKHYKRAAKVISILDDRVTYNAPYRIQFIDQAEGKPATDYFAADELTLVLRKAD